MAGEWQECTLKELALLQRGHDLTESQRKPGTVPVMGSAGQNGFHDTAIAPGPGIVVGRSGASFGKVHYCKEDYWPHNTALYVTDFQGNDPRFVYYLLSSIDFSRYNSGSAQPSLNRNYIYSIPVSFPQLAEQQAIACILGALDDKIELNRRMNQTLEAMARAIFKSWFIDFDPVRAKASGKQPPGLVPHIADLFPDSFENSELEEIPKGWRITNLGEETTATKGLSYKGQHLCGPGDGLPMHNLNSVYEGGGYKHEGLKWYKGEYRPGHLLNAGDVIVTNTEQGFDYLLIGYAAIVPKRYGPTGLFSHHIFRLRPRATSYLPPWFFYLLLRNQRFHDLVAGHTNGTTVNMLPLDGLQKPRFVLPPQPLIERFTNLFRPLQQRLGRLYDENVTLATLRDGLLPKLISGELRVPDAERIVRRCLL